MKLVEVEVPGVRIAASPGEQVGGQPACRAAAPGAGGVEEAGAVGSWGKPWLASRWHDCRGCGWAELGVRRKLVTQRVQLSRWEVDLAGALRPVLPRVRSRWAGELRAGWESRGGSGWPGEGRRS